MDRPIPGAWNATLHAARLGFIRASRGKVLYGSMILLALPYIGIAIASATGTNLDHEAQVAMMRGWTDTLLSLVAVLVAYGGVAEEVSRGSAVYFWTRPQPRWALPRGKFLSSSLLVIPAALLLIIVGSAWAGSPVPAGKLALAITLSALVHIALALAAGTLYPRHAVVTALVAMAILDLAIYAIPGAAQTISPVFIVRNLAGLLPPAGALNKILPRPNVSETTSVIVLLGQTIVFLLVAAIRVTRWEYRPRT